jgi:hypothetical protein
MLTTNEATDIRFELGIPLTPPFPVGKSDLLSKASTLDNSQILPIHNQKNRTNTNTNSRKGFHIGGGRGVDNLEKHINSSGIHCKKCSKFDLRI